MHSGPSEDSVDSGKSVAGIARYRPRIISWNITGACNLGCPHCYLDARQPWPRELNTQEAFHLIDQMAEAGTELLIISGGEPLLRPDLASCVSRATNQGILVVLGTNGMLIDRQRAKGLKENGVVAVGISIDSLDPAKHDAFRGMPGAWQQAVNGIAACRDEGLDVLIHTTALKMNQQEISAIVQFAHHRGARAFHLFFLVCTGRGERLTDLSPPEYLSLLSLILDAQEHYPDMMVRARCAPYIGRMALERGLPLFGGAGCLAGTSYCRITPVGEVTPCPYLPMVTGSVRESPLLGIWDSSPELACFRKPQLQLKGKCGQCSFSMGAICIGCRARAFALTGDVLAEDPGCVFQTLQSAGSETAAMPVTVYQGPPEPLPWTEKALERIGRVPFFIRGQAKQAAEAFARQEGLSQITEEVLEHLRQRAHGNQRPE